MWVKSHQKSEKCSKSLVWKESSYKTILWMIYLHSILFTRKAHEKKWSHSVPVYIHYVQHFSSMHIEKILSVNCILEHIYSVRETFFINAHGKTTWTINCILEHTHTHTHTHISNTCNIFHQCMYRKATFSWS